MKFSTAGILARLERFAPSGTPRRTTALYALWALALFVVFVFVTYPHDLQLRRWLASIEKQSGWKIQSESVRFVPWEGYRLSRVQITPPLTSEPAWIEADRLSLRPLLSALFFGESSRFAFDADVYGGEIDGTFSTGERTKIELEIERVSLASAAGLRRAVDGEWSGELSGRISVDAGADIRSLSGEGRLELEGLSLRGGNVSGFKVPDLAFERGDGELAIEEGRALLRKLTLAGKQLDVDVRGDLFLRQPIPLSGLNVTLGIRPVPGAAPDVENLLLVLNRNQRPPTGAYALTVSGTLGRPRLR